MQQYPYFSPLVLTDDLFLVYGGHTGTSSVQQRQIAYLLAEEQMTEYLDTPLVPTMVTGTFFWRSGLLALDYGHVLDIVQVSINSHDWANGCVLASHSGCFGRRNDEYGYLDVVSFLSCGGCGQIVGLPPYNVTVVYEAGLNSGTVTQPAMLQALTIAAQINLNEMDPSLSNEGTADIAIEKFSNQQYSESRKGLGVSTFGSSPMATRAARLVKKYRSRFGLGMR